MSEKHHRVYFAECVAHGHVYIKIGATVKSDIQKHLNDKQTFNPFRMKSLGSIECDCERKTENPYGSCLKELELQNRYQHLKVKGFYSRHEWFHASTELRDEIDRSVDSLSLV